MMQSLYRNAVLRALARLSHGALRVEDAFGSREFGKTTDLAPTPLVLRVSDERMALQAILIDEPLYERARSTVDFIKWHIFPGGCLPSLGAITRSLSRVGGLRIAHLEDLTSHYARTLACWRGRFALNRHSIRALGYPEELLRTFEFYFAYREAGFMERRISCAQIVLEKHACRLPLILGELGA
jgi:hypothetical protein